MKTPLQLCPWLFEALQQLEQAEAAGRLGHGWLFGGPRGIGKVNLAWVFADRVLNQRSGSPMPDTALAETVLAAYAEPASVAELHPDLHRIAPEEGKRSIAVEQIRDMIADLALTPLAGRHKVVVIEQADRMTREAANALLKSLEEPSGNTYLLLLAERPGRLPATIRSRCQQLMLRLPDADKIGRWLGASGLTVADLPAGLGRATPIRLADLLSDEDNLSIYIKLYTDLESLSTSGADPVAIADEWQKLDPDLALGCLIDSLRSTIRHMLVPGNRITEAGGLIMDNWARNSSIGSLFARLRMAENLREQIGRGTNIELALEALLLGLDVAEDQRLKV
jgi:DNA polymerase-3 subunit delta'